MARRKDSGNGRLEDAFTSLTQAQAALTQAQASLTQAHASLAHNQATFLERLSEMDARIAETNRINSERFARIESILMDLVHMMERLPEAVRDKIGFKGATPPT
jgi:hypothetical protein